MSLRLEKYKTDIRTNMKHIIREIQILVQTNESSPKTSRNSIS